jgi:hypothetical protein
LSSVLASPAPGLESSQNKPLSYWEPGEARPFVSGRFDGSVNFAKVQVAAGYGKPHWIWVGIEAFAITTTEFGGGFVGARASTPVLDISYGVRDNRSYLHGYLVPAGRHTASEVREETLPKQRYLVSELEISGVIPALGGYAIWDVDAERILDAPQGVEVYEESLRVITRKWAIGTRVGFVYPFGRDGVLKAGLLAEYVITPDRPSNVARLGPAMVLSITDHTEMVGALTLPISSPDSLGPVVGSWGVLGLRYKWATGDRNPHFP